MPYAHPEALVSSDWLASHLADPHVRVVDSSFKLPGITPTARADYDRGHIPGAGFFDIDDICEPGTSLPHMIPSPELFARKIGALGIGNDDRVVVYDGAGLSSAGRAWWMLRLFGHHDVAILDGGLPKWRAEGRPLDTAAQRRSAYLHRALRPPLGARQAASRHLATRREQVCPRRRPLRRHGTQPGPVCAVASPAAAASL
jgi:thiosulfate/3-mercaptopyruvate sulfurtransferase